jgi:hypothetical protein
MKSIIFWGAESDINLFIKPMYEYIKNKYRIVLLTHDIYHNNGWKDIDICYQYCDIIRINKKSINKIVNIMKSIDPEALILTNYKSIMNYMILKIAYINKIKTIFLQHGIFDKEIERLYSTNIIKSIYRYCVYIRLYLQFCYKERLPKIFIELYEIIIKRNLVKYYKIDYGIVYSGNDKQFLSANLDIESINIYTSGYPMFSGIDEENQNLSCSEDKQIVLFIHQPLKHYIKNFSIDKEIRYFNEINEVCKRNNYTLMLRLHQRHDYSVYEQLADKKIEISINDSMLDIIRNSSVVIGMNSTALYYPIVFRKPIIQLFYPNYDYPKLDFSEISLKINSFKELDSLLSNKDAQNKKLNLYSEFIDQNIGNNNSYEYLSNLLIELIRK